MDNTADLPEGYRRENNIQTVNLACNLEEGRAFPEGLIHQGKDVLYIASSSGPGTMALFLLA